MLFEMIALETKIDSFRKEYVKRNVELLKI